MREAEGRRTDTCDTGSGGGCGIGGAARDFPYLKALMQASQDGDFGPAIEHTLERYRHDSAPTVR